MKKYFFTLCLLPVLLAAFASTTAMAGTIVGTGGVNAPITYLTLIWHRNPEPNIAGYKVYYGRISGDYTLVKTVTKIRRAALWPRTRIGVRGRNRAYFAVAAYNTAGVEGELSEEVRWP